MASGIDDTKPAFEGAFLSKPVRDNFVAAKAEIETLQSSVSANIALIATNITNISTNTGDIATNAANIATNSADIATNVTNIAAIRSELDMVDLRIKNNVTNPLYQVDIDADNLSVEQYPLTNINLTVDLTASGVNGRDAGSEVSSTWYHLHVIYNPSSAITAGLFSTSPTSPVMPSLYTAKRLVGADYNDSSSNLRRIYQIQKKVMTTPVVFGGLTVANTWTAIDIRTAIPTTATHTDGDITIADNGTDIEFHLSPFSDGFTFFKFGLTIDTTPALDEIRIEEEFAMMVATPQTIYYKNITSTNTAIIDIAEWDYD